MTLSDDEEVIVDSIGLVFGGLSFICSLLTLALIYFTRKWNGYLLLLTSMTVCQIFYDINYMLRPLKPEPACVATQFFDLVGGLGVTFWTNILAFVIAYTVLFSQSINIFLLYPYFSIIAFGFPFLLGILAIVLPDVIDHGDDGIFGSCYYYRSVAGDFIFNCYYYGRLVSVLLTIIFCSMTTYRIRKMAINTNTNQSKDSADSTNQSRAILRTVKKMNYYAVAQVICRSGAAWNEFYYGTYSSYESNIAASVCSPSTGILNFLIFLFMQPNAYKNFKYLVCCMIPPPPRSNSNDSVKRSGDGTNNKKDFVFRDKFISQADYDHHGIINAIHQGNQTGSMFEYFYPTNPSITSERTDGNSFIELGRTSTQGTGFVPSRNVSTVPPQPIQAFTFSTRKKEKEEPIQEVESEETTPHVTRPSSRSSLHSAYDFFDEDYEESGRGMSNSFHIRKSGWNMRDSDADSNIDDQRLTDVSSRPISQSIRNGLPYNGNTESEQGDDDNSLEGR